MKFEVRGAPHLPPTTTVPWVMGQVLIALVPGLIAHVVYFGPGVLFQCVIAVGTAVALEATMLHLRGRPVRRFLGDLSAPLTAVLLVLCLPPLVPWWVTVTGVFFAIVLAKHLYGGLGYNLFNPAMVGYVAVLISFPRDASTWIAPLPLLDQAPSPGAILGSITTGGAPSAGGWDAVTRATPLDLISTAHTDNLMVAEALDDPVMGPRGAIGWQPIAWAYLAGGIFLLYRRVISWHVPVAVLGGLLVGATLLYLVDSFANPPPLQQLFLGGAMLGAFFIATDPVSGCASPRGRLLFGLGVALIILVIRRWGAYPDGVAFGVLVMNMAAPLIDRYLRTRTYGT